MNNDLISREAALEIVMKYCPDDDGSCSSANVDLREMLDEIEAIPAVDAEPVRHGHWKSRGNSLECSECGHEFTKYDWEGSIVAYYWCPSCGAKMHVERWE